MTGAAWRPLTVRRGNQQAGHQHEDAAQQNEGRAPAHEISENPAHQRPGGLTADAAGQEAREHGLTALGWHDIGDVSHAQRHAARGEAPAGKAPCGQCFEAARHGATQGGDPRESGEQSDGAQRAVAIAQGAMHILRKGRGKRIRGDDDRNCRHRGRVLDGEARQHGFGNALAHPGVGSRQREHEYGESHCEALFQCMIGVRFYSLARTGIAHGPPHPRPGYHGALHR